MSNFFIILREDFQTNRAAGVNTVLFLWNYRLGRLLLVARRKYGKLMLPIYLGPLVLARMLSLVYGCSLPFSAEIGRRVRFQHGLNGIFVSSMAVIGDECTILHHVTIGSNIGARGVVPAAPVLGRGVFIGVGAKIIGDVRVGNGVTIGAQALVIENVPAGARARAPRAQIVAAKDA